MKRIAFYLQGWDPKKTDGVRLSCEAFPKRIFRFKWLVYIWPKKPKSGIYTSPLYKTGNRDRFWASPKRSLPTQNQAYMESTRGSCLLFKGVLHFHCADECRNSKPHQSPLHVICVIRLMTNFGIYRTEQPSRRLSADSGFSGAVV